MGRENVTMAEGRKVRNRPYWHVDAKWVTSLLLVPLLAAAFLIHTLVQITAEGPAVETASLLLGLMFSRDGLDEETDVAAFRQQLEADPDGCIQPIEALRISVCQEDIADLPPREARLLIFRQIAQPLYQDGADGLAGLASDPEAGSTMSQGIGLLSFFTRETHLALTRVLAILALGCAALFVPLILFSFRFGRIGSPGCAIAAAAIPGAVLFAFFAVIFNPPPPAAGEPGMTEIAGALAAEVLPAIARIAIGTYLIAVGAGLLLILFSILGTVVSRLRRGRNALGTPAEPVPNMTERRQS